MFDVMHGKDDEGKVVMEVTRIMLAVERVSMRLGTMSLAAWVQVHYGVNPIQLGTLWLFCGRRPKMIKGLLYRPTGFVLITKTCADGVYQWPRCEDQLMELTSDQFERLMKGYTIIPTIRVPKIPTDVS